MSCVVWEKLRDDLDILVIEKEGFNPNYETPLYCTELEDSLKEFQEEHLTKCLEKIEEGMELHHKMDTRLGWDEQNPKLSLEGKTPKEVAFKDDMYDGRERPWWNKTDYEEVFLPNINQNLKVFEEALGDYLHC
ncbi:hypothetical protein [Helicobacter suis]|uniref:hypothetical protein n=1 Tax=Helicobacter suis TaxID=104628 RepID=UPI0022019BB9|nr:hypothetical protein [Helicobacter suis]BDR27983.1 hypothetical protein HSHS1_07440 [Helicobacter suis HS1]